MLRRDLSIDPAGRVKCRRVHTSSEPNPWGQWTRDNNPRLWLLPLRELHQVSSEPHKTGLFKANRLPPTQTCRFRNRSHLASSLPLYILLGLRIVHTVLWSQYEVASLLLGIEACRFGPLPKCGSPPYWKFLLYFLSSSVRGLPTPRFVMLTGLVHCGLAFVVSQQSRTNHCLAFSRMHPSHEHNAERGQMNEARRNPHNEAAELLIL